MRRASLARTLAVACLITGLGSLSNAAPTAETRYQGARLGFSLPTGWKVKDVLDVAAEYAVELVAPPHGPASGAHLRILVANGKTSEAEIESAANALRDARLKSRASWGVKAKGDRRAEIGHLGSRRTVRLFDQMGSVLGASQQVMLCASYNSRLVCGVADGPPEAQRAGEAALVRALETLALVK